MKRIFIGHRGVGKSQLLLRHQAFTSDIPHFDLDSEIEKNINSSIVDFFNFYGEENFRNKEIEVYNNLIQNNPQYVIAVGAGFQVESIAKTNEIIYVARATDADGRIFLNRPRLEKNMSPINEYKSRYLKRNDKYLSVAHSLYYMPEGLDFSSDIEKEIFNNNELATDAYYTLSNNEILHLDACTNKYKNIELRTDLISHTDIVEILKKYPNFNWLLSIRDKNWNHQLEYKNRDVDVLYYFKGCHIVSTHNADIKLGIAELNLIKEHIHLKLCPEVENFVQLVLGYEWQQKDPKNRSFLPRSNTGRWLWYRQVAKYLQKINFIKSFTNNKDQPTLFEWLSLPAERPKHWAAVIGSPIHFSRSPMQHFIYFKNKNSFFTRIDMSDVELTTHVNFLKSLGLREIAVTSPLKKAAYQLSKNTTSLKAINTLMLIKDEILSLNTDTDGFSYLINEIAPLSSVAVWGGGGTLAMMQQLLPQAVYYSSQTGKPRELNISELSQYDYLIWAAPRNENTKIPNENIKIKKVIDLNYTENSQGLEFATLRNISYTSGLAMFKQQALKQQEFWSMYECK